MKTFTMNGHLSGRQFSFNAKDEKDAIWKAKGWCHYHSINFEENYYIKEINETNPYDLHNEFIKN